MKILAVDPGRAKCGIAVVDDSGAVLEKKVVDRAGLKAEVGAMKAKHAPDVLVIGDSTGTREALAELRDLFAEDRIHQVDERNSTLEGRYRYFDENPPRGLWRLVPLSLRYPPVPFDDYVAVILAERFIAPNTRS